MRSKQELGGLDVFKMVAALLVVTIHTSPLSSFTEQGDFILTRIVARVAVPFFLMVTGYFLVTPYLFERKTDKMPLFHFLKKTLLLYGAAILLYLPVNIYAGHFKGLSFFDILYMVAIDGTFYHLWYLPASILGVWLVYLLSRILSFRGVFISSLLLYLVGLLGDSYFGLMEQSSVLSAFYKVLLEAFPYTRNGIFYVPIFLVLGAFWGHFRGAISRKGAVTGFLLSFPLLLVEGLTLHQLGVQRHDSMYLALLPCVFFLFRMVESVKMAPKKSLRTIATGMYLLHPMCIVVVRGAAKLLHMETLLVKNSIVHYLAVCVASYIAASFIEKLLAVKKQKAYQKGRGWIEIDGGRLAENVAELRRHLPPQCELMPALKANGYGHGAVLVGRKLNSLGILSFCVATVSEGVELRRHRVKGEILILGYTHPEEFSLLRRYRLTQTVVDFSYAQLLNGYGKKLHVHLKIDTGMHRLGERSDQLNRLCGVFRCENLVIKGAYTHLSAPNDEAFTQSQVRAFYTAVEGLKAQGCTCPKVHLLASSGLLRYPGIGGDYARVGIALYGVMSSRTEVESCPNQLQPVLSVKARVALVRDLYAGECAGYEKGFTAERDMKIAVLSIGYGDGIPRSLSYGRGRVLINGNEAPIIGRICMDQMLVNVSGMDSPIPGDIAVIIGSSGEREINVYEIAEEADTITNEVLCRLGSRLERVLV